MDRTGRTFRRANFFKVYLSSASLHTALLSALLVWACQPPAGPPPTLEAGAVSHEYTGGMLGTFSADGRCYWSTGYPPADDACAVALDLGDTVRIRAVRAPRTAGWQHMNLEFPEDGPCAGGGCRIAVDFLDAAGDVERSFRSVEADVTISQRTGNRMSGTFSGRAVEIDGLVRDTIGIVNGTFDVPVRR